MALRRHRLVHRREAVGLTQEGLAGQAGVDRTTIGRWERGEGSPQPWQRPRLARSLHVDTDELDILLTCDGGDAIEQRREHALRHPSQIDLATATELREDHERLAARYDRVPSAGLLAEAGQQLSQVTFMAGEARRGRVQRELRILQADASTLMGQLIWDASQRRDHVTARSYYDQSVTVARHLRDRTLEGHALLRTSYVALYGARDPYAGLELSLRAAHTAERTSHALTGLALLHAGEAHAMLGQTADCERTLAKAESHLEEADDTDAAADLVSSTLFGRLAGSCYLSLGKHRRAQEFLENTAGQLQERRKSRAIVLGNLALAHIRQRQVDAGIAALTDAIEEVERTRGGGGTNIVFGAARELRPWREEKMVADVHDRLLTLMTAP